MGNFMISDIVGRVVSWGRRRVVMIVKTVMMMMMMMKKKNPSKGKYNRDGIDAHENERNKH